MIESIKNAIKSGYDLEIEECLTTINNEQELVIIEAKRCKNCKWLSDDFSSVCVNGDSEHCADFVSHNYLCIEWSAK